MKKEHTDQMIAVAAGGLCCIGFLTTAVAFPPFSQGRSSQSKIDAARPRSTVGRSLAHADAKQLDLHPPRDSPSALSHGGGDAPALPPFPSSIHHLDLSK